MNTENSYIWLITANGLPVETHEDQHTAYAIATKWNQGTSSNIELHKIPLYKNQKITNFKEIREKNLEIGYLSA